MKRLNTPNANIGLYGAGTQAVVEKLTIEAKGIKPVCFIDKDIMKHGTIYLGLPVLDLNTALKKYKNLKIYVTLAEDLKYTVMEYLISCKIKKADILNYKETEYYEGCRNLETCLNLNEDHLRICCVKRDDEDVFPFINWTGDIENDISSYIDTRNILISGIKNGVPNICSKCRYIKKSNYLKEKKILNLGYGFNNPCQLSCIYCTAQNAKRHFTIEKNRFMQDFNFSLFIKKLEEHGLLASEAIITLGAGEITIDRKKNMILDTLKKYRLSVLTNCVVFDNRIAELRSQVEIIVSVDSGTCETYKRVKGINAFDIVWKNIKKYTTYGVNVDAKFIFLPENSNEDDVIGFIQESLNAGVKKITISTDVWKKEQHSYAQFNYIIKMWYLAVQAGINPTFCETFNSNEINKINQLKVEMNL